jgi:hypothetical protein
LAVDLLRVEPRFVAERFAVERLAVARFVEDFFAVERLVADFLPLDFLAVERLELLRLLGTLAPASRASDSPIAIACSRLFTLG